MYVYLFEFLILCLNLNLKSDSKRWKNMSYEDLKNGSEKPTRESKCTEIFKGKMEIEMIK